MSSQLTSGNTALFAISILLIICSLIIILLIAMLQKHRKEKLLFESKYQELKEKYNQLELEN
ncbi:MAG TPA: hypothetical protein PLG33_08015, partial [Prolixibacteraceae bacterium]|nr:hypothetical protein [Prolixibacteraceae bacterium]